METDKVKKLGCKWCTQLKLWYIENDNKYIKELKEKNGKEIVKKDKIYLKLYPFRYNGIIR